ncbi:hypothetical protein GLOIN_2v1845426 [Rhizophagus clarus]|uniref:Secreted protein n=1 Tax=Rhizophagus clarus TaxID=94130 RepID=A0A8H3MKV3_9GLOM|nr:hypothetical protein GLOIN_2v1845426 [Rhizophagus clarus]
MKYSKIFFNLTISLIFFLATHIAEAYHIQVFSTLTIGSDCWGTVLDPNTNQVYYDTGLKEGEQDTCYEMSGVESDWFLNVVDCSKFSGVTSSCE